MLGKAAEHAAEEVTHYAVHQEPMVFLVILLILFIVACGVAVTFAIVHWVQIVGVKTMKFVDDLQKKVDELFSAQTDHIVESTKKKQLIEELGETTRATYVVMRKIARKLDIDY